jgi:hypothetical protein
MDKQEFLDKVIVHMGGPWKIIGVGAQRDGNIFCHLASTRDFRQQKNGRTPLQICDWIDTAVLRAAR